MRVLLFPAPGAFRASIETLLYESGVDDVEILEDGTMRVADGVVLEVREAAVLSYPLAYAVVVRLGSLVASIVLAHDLAEAKAAIEDLDDERLAASVVELEGMPLPSPVIRHPRWRVAADSRQTVSEGDLDRGYAGAMTGRLAELGALIARVDALKPAAGGLSLEICPRCEDHQLHLDPTLDPRDHAGQRICIACARLMEFRRTSDDGRSDRGLGL